MSRTSMVRLIRRGVIAGAMVSLAAGTLAPIAGAGAAPPRAPMASTNRQDVYAQAAREFGVPTRVLLAVSYLESRWDVHDGQPSRAGGYGPMHLTDLAAAGDPLAAPDGGAGEVRGDPARPGALSMPKGPAFQTIDVASRLSGIDKATLRTDPAANIRGGAALLSDYHRQLGALGATGAGAWYAAVARYSGASDQSTAKAFADEVYSALRTGERRTTDDGQDVALSAESVKPDRSALGKLGLSAASATDETECPNNLGCEWIPAPYQDLGGGDYGNHDLANRPANQKISYIVIHDTEGSYATTLTLAQDPTYVSWHYTLRDSDGHVAQHVKAKDVAWHAGNWYVNAKSIGIEHEGYGARGTWYTEAMYRSSAKLVRYLAQKYEIPLDRQHILGHDNVQGITPANISGMHWDPGPYWDWAHYFDLLGAPFRTTGNAKSGAVTIRPHFATNMPAFSGCESIPGPPDEGVPPQCGAWGSSAVVLHTAPNQRAPLLLDIGSNPPDGVSSMNVADVGSRVSTGQQYAVADVQGDWTAIWYLGQKGWFFNPHTARTALWADTLVATPKAGKASIPVYGRAYPEPEAYPADVPVQAIVPLQYTLPVGQEYVVGMKAEAEYYYAVTFDESTSHQVIRGALQYYQIQFGHRVAYVRADDVDVHPSAR